MSSTPGLYHIKDQEPSQPCSSPVSVAVAWQPSGGHVLCRPLLWTGAVERNPAKKDRRQKRDPAICWRGCTINKSRKASACQGRTSCIDKRGCFKRVDGN